MIFEHEKEFMEFRNKNTHLRFWEALKQFSGVDAIIIRKGDATMDTEYWQDLKL